METVPQPSERLTWEEIVARYPNEWVYILEPEMGEGVAILSGIVLTHHVDKRTLVHLASKASDQINLTGLTTTLTFTGTILNQTHPWRAFSILRDQQKTI